MCGICGFFGKKKNKREIVEKMKEKLVHRGPDAQGSFVNDSVALGFRRLSIIDLEGGWQPLHAGGSTVIGPLLVGLDKSVQIVSMGAKDSDIVNMATLAAYNSGV